MFRCFVIMWVYILVLLIWSWLEGDAFRMLPCSVLTRFALLSVTYLASFMGTLYSRINSLHVRWNLVL